MFPLSPSGPPKQVPTTSGPRHDFMAWDCRWITDNLRLALPESSLALQHSPAITSYLPASLPHPPHPPPSSSSTSGASTATSIPSPALAPPLPPTKNTAHAKACRFRAWACRSSRAQKKLRNLAAAAAAATTNHSSPSPSSRNKNLKAPSITHVTDTLSSISLTSPLFMSPSSSSRRLSATSITATAPPTYSSSDLNIMQEDPDADGEPDDSNTREMRIAQFFPHPNISIPTPQLEFDLRLSVTFSQTPTHVALHGTSKDLYAAISGTWAATFARGTISAGGHDMQIPQATASSPTEYPTARKKLDTVFTLSTTDDPPAIINLRTRGYLACNTGVLSSFFAAGDASSPASSPAGADSFAQSEIAECMSTNSTLANALDPRKYSCRMVLTLTTSDRRYADDLNMALWIGSGMWRSTSELIIDAYRIS